MPALLSLRNCPRTIVLPVRVKLLVRAPAGVPRFSEGKLGLIDEFCAHRGVSLWFGRNEDCGLRCPYHGWKYDVTSGQCVDVPSEPAESGYAKKIKLKSYPLIDQGGVLWTYMGDPEQASRPLPEFEFSNGAAGPDSFTTKRIQECELAAGDGRWHRFQPRLVFAPRRSFNNDPLFKGAAGNKYNLCRTCPSRSSK